MKPREIIVFTALLLFILLPNFLVVSMADDVATPSLRTYYVVQSLAFYGVGLFLFHRRAFLYLASLGFPFSAFELFHLFTRGRTVTHLYLYTWLKTSPEDLQALYQPYVWLFVLGIVIWILFYVLAHYFVEREYILPLKWRLPIASLMAATFLALPLNICPQNTVHRFSTLAQGALHVERTQPQRNKFSYGITPNTSKADETMIVVVGETSYQQWKSLNYKDSLAIDFSSVYAKCPVAGVAMPMLFSRATPDNVQPFFRERSVIKAFAEAGFYTAWLSDYGYHDHFLMRLADDCRYLSYQPNQPDTALLEPFREVMRRPEQRHMVVLVTQGGRDSSSLAQVPYLLRQLTDSLRTTHQPAMLVYVGSPAIRLGGRTPLNLHVPMMVWANPNYRYRHRAMIRTMQAQRSLPMSTASLYHSLLYWNNISCEQRIDSMAIGCQQFEAADSIRYLDENLQAQSFFP